MITIQRVTSNVQMLTKFLRHYEMGEKVYNKKKSIFINKEARNLDGFYVLQTATSVAVVILDSKLCMVR
jgi:hypothetical protein